jgi:hypothetical protein
LIGSATYPLMARRANAAARRLREAFARPLLIMSIMSLVAVLFLPAAAHATSGQGMIVMMRWKSMDTCAIQAQRAFPNFTAESNAQRDAKLKECLAGQNLPPREALSPPR